MHTGAALTMEQWLEANHAAEVCPVVKDIADTMAWTAVLEGKEAFLKFFPPPFDRGRTAVEIAIAGANLHPAIVPLRRNISLADGVLLLYDRVSGDNLGSMDDRKRFQLLPLAERIQAVTAIFEVLAAICEAGFMLVDWYEGNMMYDFAAQRIMALRLGIVPQRLRLHARNGKQLRFVALDGPRRIFARQFFGGTHTCFQSWTLYSADPAGTCRTTRACSCPRYAPGPRRTVRYAP